MQKKAEYYIGFALVILGALFLIGNFVNLTKFWSIFWPIFVCLPGLFFWWLWQKMANRKKTWGILIPAVFLISLSIGFFINSIVTVFFDYSMIWAWTSFMYIGALAVAFGVSWLVTGNRGVMIVTKILASIALVIFIVVGLSILIFSILPSNIFWPVIVIVTGIIIIFGEKTFELMFKNHRFFGKSKEDWQKWGEALAKDFERK